jgi:hypothetical protein
MARGKDKVSTVMGEFKRGTLRAGRDPAGPKKAPKVKSRKQAIAIALSEAGMSRKPEKRAKGGAMCAAKGGAVKKFSPISRAQRFEGMK